MKVGDLVKIKDIFTAHGLYESEESKIAMIIEGPNEVSKIKLLLSNGNIVWCHTGEVEYMPKDRRYFQE
tara:strand:+ start:105 stop:311 length:207 start_codon:yes stop_codon:yes gene_type:complete